MHFTTGRYHSHGQFIHHQYAPFNFTRSRFTLEADNFIHNFWKKRWREQIDIKLMMQRTYISPRNSMAWAARPTINPKGVASGIIIDFRTTAPLIRSRIKGKKNDEWHIFAWPLHIEWAKCVNNITVSRAFTSSLTAKKKEEKKTRRFWRNRAVRRFLVGWKIDN